MKFTTSDGAEYILDEYGIHQLNPKPFVYDTNYCAVYDDPERQKKSDQLQALRLGFIIGAHGRVPDDILDFGAGNYAFLNYAKSIIPACYGYDLADYPVPDGIVKTNYIYRDYDVITFHDCLEHILEPEFVVGLKCQTIVISLPNVWGIVKNWSDYTEAVDEEAFDKFYHRKPGEHLHHFTPNGLQRFMSDNGWRQVAVSKHEDVIRQRGEWNIISAAFKRK
ncbi:MAG: methyltransferase domain-containing protein [Agriterribacter sp.]